MKTCRTASSTVYRYGLTGPQPIDGHGFRAALRTNARHHPDNAPCGGRVQPARPDHPLSKAVEDSWPTPVFLPAKAHAQLVSAPPCSYDTECTRSSAKNKNSPGPGRINPVAQTRPRSKFIGVKSRDGSCGCWRVREDEVPLLGSERGLSAGLGDHCVAPRTSRPCTGSPDESVNRTKPPQSYVALTTLKTIRISGGKSMLQSASC
jgi:hypothetical protein